MRASYAYALRELGGLDILVSNAGIASAAPIEETPLELWSRNMGILATGYFLVAREAFALMKRQGLGGSIVFVGSKNALVASAGASAYCAAKAAVAPPRALPGARRGRARHPRERGEPRRGDPRLAHLGRQLARRSAPPRNRIADAEVEDFYRKRSLLKRSVLPGGRRRGRLLLRLGAVGQVDRQHPQRGRGQRRRPSRASEDPMSFRIDEEFVLRAEPQGARLARGGLRPPRRGSSRGAGSTSSGSPSGRWRSAWRCPRGASAPAARASRASRARASRATSSRSSTTARSIQRWCA